MGNCFSLQKRTDSNPFSNPGRRLNDTPDLPPSPRYGAKPPAIFHTQSPNVEPVHHSPDQMDRSLGGAHSTGSPREAAAKAAEARAARAKGNQGKLGQQLAQQKQQTRTDTLEAASKQERQTRAADENNRTLQHN
ncbi:MAG: hypothetical protein MMC23_004953 [Stictis urceolatum]|nr:hypothetical protein [Stictis urceolata]